MLDGISSREWSEWQAYWNEYGFGERRMDGRFAQLMVLLANIFKGKDSPPVTADDILPNEDEDDEGDEYGESDELSEIVDEDQLIFEATVREAMG